MQIKPEFHIRDGKKLWLMPDGEYIPYIAGGNDHDTATEAALTAEKEKTAEARGDAAKYREKLRDLETRTAGFDADEFKKMKDAQVKQAEDQDLAKGNYEKLLSEKTAALEADSAKHKESANAWKYKYENKVIGDAVAVSANAAGAMNATDVQQIVSGIYKLSMSDDGKIEIKKGDSVATDGSGNTLTLDAVIKQTLDDRPYMVKSADAGAGANKGTSNHNNGDKTKEQKIRDGLKKLRG